LWIAEEHVESLQRALLLTVHTRVVVKVRAVERSAQIIFWRNPRPNRELSRTALVTSSRTHKMDSSSVNGGELVCHEIAPPASTELVLAHKLR